MVLAMASARSAAACDLSLSPRRASHLRHGGGGLLIEESEIDLLVGHAAGPALDPAGALAVVVDAVWSGRRGSVSKAQAFSTASRLCGEESDVAAGSHIVEHGEEEERRGIGGGVHVGELLPVDGGRGLRVLVHDFAVVALAVNEELELGLRKGEVAVAVDSVEGVEGVAAEEPAEAGARGVAGGIVAGDQGGFASPAKPSRFPLRDCGLRCGDGTPWL